MDIRSYLVKVGLWTNHSVKGKIEEILPVHFPLGLWRQRRLATIATAVEGDSGGVSTAAAVGTTAAEAGGLQPRWQFATMEAEEGANTYLQIILSVQMSAQISGHASRYLVTPRRHIT